MSRIIGTTIRTLRTPVFKEGDDVKSIVLSSVLEASKQGNYQLKAGDIVAVTESVVARTQGNYASIDQISADVKKKFSVDEIGLVFPILSRNRFSILLKGIAKGFKKIYIQLSYPSDEVGNALFDSRLLVDKKINPYTDVLNENEYREAFGYEKHQFTGVDYVEYYRDIAKSVDTEVEFLFSNNPESILKLTSDVLCCDIHTRARTLEILKEKGANAYTLSDILTESVDNSGYNSQYGLLGSNKANEESVKLFPRDCNILAQSIQDELKSMGHDGIEVLIYGDGAFKDPVGKIWELADPVVGVGYTEGLKGTPNELKLKYLADEKFAALKGEELKKAITEEIKSKHENLVGNEVSEGTTPRQLTDLIGSLCDLSSGSGDKGTPVIYIQGYFDNYADQ